MSAKTALLAYADGDLRPVLCKPKRKARAARARAWTRGGASPGPAVALRGGSITGFCLGGRPSWDYR